MTVKKRTKEELRQHSIYKNAEVMYLVLSAYTPFHQMMIERRAALNKSTYEDAEGTSTLIKGLLRMDCNPESFLGKENEHADKAIEYYEEFKEHLMRYDDFIQKTMLAFCNHLHHNFISVHFEMGGCFFYPDSLLAFMCYAEGSVTIEQLKGTFIEVSLFMQTTKVIDSKYFRSDMIKMATIYHRIWCKRKKRLEKRILNQYQQ